MDASKVQEKVNGKTQATFPTMVDIKKVIPKHCFEPEVSTSMYYVFRDLAAVASLHLTFEWMRVSLPWYIVYAVAPVYAFLKGTFFVALFIIGHDCSHGSFSRHKLLNDVVGGVLHTALLMPYSCWKYSHRVHHKNTCNIDKDELFFPLRKREILWQPENSLLWTAYLAVDSGPRSVRSYDDLIHTYVDGGRRIESVVSLMLDALWAAILYQYAVHYGWDSLLLHFVLPLIAHLLWGLVITFLQHADDDIPWVSHEKWNYVQGQLSTVDRHYGWFHGIIHNVGTHHLHHLFPKLPHYHLEEATLAFKKSYPHLLRVNPAPILPSFFRLFWKYLRTRVIEDDEEVYWYR
ncbi:sn-1 acyl-lipid omega-3 desaturase (ferredoxin)-like [Liolophura sinensis]|uniref:sn-1 acyl-lipid omega-3 desaturase (ferredoxin)-like n=1 Tax=Liolophura sinensis TaxID=3198878 RepID=UPI003158AEB8